VRVVVCAAFLSCLLPGIAAAYESLLTLPLNGNPSYLLHHAESSVAAAPSGTEIPIKEAAGPVEILATAGSIPNNGMLTTPGQNRVNAGVGNESVSTTDNDGQLQLPYALMLALIAIVVLGPVSRRSK